MGEYIAIDTETELIQPGLLAPPLVCLSYAHSGGSGITKWKDAAELFRTFVEDFDTFVGHNIAYDFGVLIAHDWTLTDTIFKLFREDRVRDTGIREALYLIREGIFTENRGNLTLNALSKKYLREELDKSGDSWRLRYAELMNVSLSAWPKEAKQYSIKDAEATLNVFQEQEDSPDEILQCRAAWSMHLMSVYGVKTDGSAVNKIEEDLVTHIGVLRKKVVAAGYIREELPVVPKFTKVFQKKLNKMIKEGLENEAEDLRSEFLMIQEEARQRPSKFIKNTADIKRVVEDSLGTRAPRTPPSSATE